MPEVILRIQSASNNPLEELEFSHFVADCVESHLIGRVTGSGYGFGQADIGIEVEDLAVASLQLQGLTKSLGIQGRVAIDSLPPLPEGD